ncbi:14554_t:CDS:1, partial [Cetraspora pellucida]
NHIIKILNYNQEQHQTASSKGYKDMNFEVSNIVVKVLKNENDDN